MENNTPSLPDDRKSKTLKEELVAHEMPLVCPCGLPLTLYQRTNGEWMIGHFEKACLPMVSGGANAVLKAVLNGVIRDYKPPVAKERP